MAELSRLKQTAPVGQIGQDEIEFLAAQGFERQSNNRWTRQDNDGDAIATQILQYLPWDKPLGSPHRRRGWFALRVSLFGTGDWESPSFDTVSAAYVYAEAQQWQS